MPFGSGSNSQRGAQVLVDDALLRAWALPDLEEGGDKEERGSVLVVRLALRRWTRRTRSLGLERRACRARRRIARSRRDRGAGRGVGGGAARRGRPRLSARVGRLGYLARELAGEVPRVTARLRTG